MRPRAIPKTTANPFTSNDVGIRNLIRLCPQWVGNGEILLKRRTGIIVEVRNGMPHRDITLKVDFTTQSRLSGVHIPNSFPIRPHVARDEEATGKDIGR